MENRKIVTGIWMLILVLTLSSVSAEFWACFEKGDVVEYCSGYKPDWTCGSSSGCIRCMSVYREGEDCYVHGSWPKCNEVEQSCLTFDSNHTIDSEPPEFVLNSPVDGELYDSRSVLIDFDLDEIADIYYYDNVNGRGNWVRVCSDCPAGDSVYSRVRSFKDGLNNLTFRAVDVVGNDVYFDVSFFVDSKRPRIRGSEPRREFADGRFIVEVDEDNLEEVRLVVDGAQKTEEFNVSDCVDDGRYKVCSVDVNLSDYDGGEILYWFVVEDIAGNSVSSRAVKLDVDVSEPVLNNPDDFWEQGVGRYARYIYFDLNVSEENLDEIDYSYVDSRGRVKEKRLCSRLRDGICSVKKSFRDGDELLGIRIVDDAGNSVFEEIGFVVEY